MTKPIAINSPAAFILASRPKTLGAIICPVLIGNALAFAQGMFSKNLFLLTMLACVFLQILANLINDYGDFIKGSDSPDRLGPMRAMQMGFITMPAMKLGIAITIAAIILLGCPLMVQGGWPIFFGGSVGLILCAWYTLGKRPLAYVGFVEIIIFFVFGPLAVLFSSYVQTLSFSQEAVVISLSPGFLSTALLLTNNLRDITEDRLHQKLTTAVRLGELFARRAIVLLLILAILGPIILVWVYSYSFLMVLANLALLLPLRHVSMILKEPISKRFNLMLSSIGQSLYLFGVFLSLGIIYGAP